MPSVVREMSPWRMVAYGGATWDWHEMHYDRVSAEKLGLQAPIVDGQLFGGLLAMALQQWLGPEVALRALSFRFAAPVYVGETIRCHGEVIETADESIRCGLGVTVIDLAGARVRDAISSAFADVYRR
jgi:acyl dehydratase